MERELEVVGSCTTWRNCMRDVHEERWQEEVGEKFSLKWYRLAKEEFGQERYVREFGSKGEVRLRRQRYCTPSHRSQSSSNPRGWVVGDIAGAVQAVAVKVPTFWPTRPEVWFFLLESQFTTKNITADDTKYQDAVQGLDKTTLKKSLPSF